MLRLPLLSLRWKIKLRYLLTYKPSPKKLAWHKEVIAVAAIYIFTGWLWYWGFRIPSPGKAVAVLAVAAAVMSLRGEMDGKEKLAWILLLFGFLTVENRSIDVERTAAVQSENDRRDLEHIRRTQENSEFRNIANRMTAAMQEVEGGTGYVFFVVMARHEKELPVMMFNQNDVPIRDVNLEIIAGSPSGSPREMSQLAYSTFHPKLVRIGDVTPGAKYAQFALAPGKYNIRIMTRLGVFNEYLEVSRGSSVAGGWREEYCVMKNNSSEVLRGQCPK